MNNIISNLNNQIKQLNNQDDKLRSNGLTWSSTDRGNIRACMLDIKNIIKTLKTIK